MLDRIAPECEYRRKEAGKRSLYGFPKDPVRLQKWLKLIPRADFKPSKQSKLCEMHHVQTISLCTIVYCELNVGVNFVTYLLRWFYNLLYATIT